MSYSTYDDNSFDEWDVIVRCDGRPTPLKVRRRVGHHHANETGFRMESFEILQGDEKKCVFVLPTAAPHREAAKHAAMQTLPQFIGCTEILGESGRDPADVIFGVPRE